MKQVRITLNELMNRIEKIKDLNFIFIPSSSAQRAAGYGLYHLIKKDGDTLFLVDRDIEPENAVCIARRYGVLRWHHKIIADYKTMAGKRESKLWPKRTRNKPASRQVKKTPVP